MTPPPHEFPHLDVAKRTDVTTDPTNPRDSIPQPDQPSSAMTPEDGWSVAGPSVTADDTAVRSVLMMDQNTDPQPPEQLPGVAEYNARAKQGIKLMLGRQVFIQVFTFAGGIVLARTLTPEIFGIFGIATFFVATLALFGDFGLAPSLVQRKKELTEKDLQVAFTLQQVLLTAVAIAVWIGAPYFLLIYPDIGGSEITWLIRVMAVTLFLQSWRSMSVLQMERHLNFKKIAWIEVVEALSYQALAVGLAVAGFGVWSLVWATLARAVLGTSLAFAASPWRVRFAWDYIKAKEILRFGLPFQAGEILNSAGNWVTPILVGTLIGPAGVGFITWASSNAQKPLWAFGSIVRVAFPHFSRLQGDRAGLGHAFERYLLPPFLACGLWFVGLATAAPDLVPLVYGEQWTPAITLLKLYGAMMAFNILAWLGASMLRATGFAGYAAIITGFKTLGMIAAAVALIPLLGTAGVPVGMIFGSLLMTLLQWRLLDRSVVISGLSVLARVLLASAVGAGVGTLVRQPIEHALLSGLCAGSVGSAAFLLVAWLIAPPWFRQKARGQVRRATTATKSWLGRHPGVPNLVETAS